MHLRILSLIACILGGTAPAVVRAADVELSPFYGYRFGGEFEDGTTDETYSIADSPVYGVMLDLPVGGNAVRTELLWCRQDTHLEIVTADGPGEIDMTIDSWELGAIAEETKDKFVEYISAHVGLTHMSAGSFGSDTLVNLSAGVGAKFFLKPNVALKTEVRGICTFVDGDATFISIDGITRIEFTGSTLWQGQATVGLSVIF